MKKSLIFKLFLALSFASLILVVTLVGINLHLLKSSSERVLTKSEAAQLSEVDCIVVLGCLVKNDGTPSHMLHDRIQVGTDLYFMGVAPKILMSGDHGNVDYNEVGTMKAIAISEGIPSSDVFMDHAGFSTYESIYRAKEIFGADKIVIVTQEYHLSRALYIAEALGIEAYGVSADLRTYSKQIVRDVREILARAKDFALAQIKPEPTYLGEAIPISGDGDTTNDY